MFQGYSFGVFNQPWYGKAGNVFYCSMPYCRALRKILYSSVLYGVDCISYKFPSLKCTQMHIQILALHLQSLIVLGPMYCCSSFRLLFFSPGCFSILLYLLIIIGFLQQPAHYTMQPTTADKGEGFVIILPLITVLASA